MKRVRMLIDGTWSFVNVVSFVVKQRGTKDARGPTATRARPGGAEPTLTYLAIFAVGNSRTAKAATRTWPRG